MSIKKYLAGVSVVAMVAGGASALTLTQADADGSNAVPVAGVIETAAFVANEATFAAIGSDIGTFELRLDAAGTFAASENYFVDVVVSGGTFATNLTGAEVTDGDGGSGITVSGSSVQSVGLPAGIATGQAGDSSVRFLVSNSPTPGDNFGLELPIQYNGCPSDLNFTVTVRTSGGVTFEQGTVALSTPALQCGNAYLASIATDIIGAANDSILASPTFSRFVAGTTTTATDIGADGTTTPGGADTGTVGTLGVVTVAFDPGGVASSFLTSLNESTGPLVGADAEVLSAAFDVEVSNPTGLANVLTTETGGSFGITTGTASVTVPITTTALAANNFVENIAMELAAVAATIAQQAVTTTSGVLNFGAGLGVVASEDIADASLDSLNYEGVVCGPFDWVGDASRPTRNIFRITDHGAATTSVVATINNASVGTPSRTATLTKSFDFTAPQLVINQNDLTDDLGPFGIADVTLNFIGGSSGLDCDRLMNNTNPATIVVPFGNDNGAQSNSDD